MEPWLELGEELDVKREDRRRLAERAEVVKAMAHPTRLYLVEQLAAGERCVCDLTDGVGSDISTVSRHLGILRNAGLLDSERRGKQIYYRLRAPCVLGLFDCIENVLNASDEAAAACATRGEGR